MATHKQLKANRLNAQKCTGPSSVEGKARSSWNALKSGIHAESEVLPWEDPAERAALRDEYHHYHQPCTPEERSMVNNLVHGEFLSRRFRRSEVKIILSHIPEDADLDDEAVIGRVYAAASAELGRLQRRMDANNRAYHRDLDELRLLKAERPPVEPPPPPLVLVPPQPEPQPTETESPEPATQSPTNPQPPIHSRSGEPNPQPPPSLSTAQATEPATQTEQSVSFRQTPETAPALPRGFNPKNPHHPPIQKCVRCYPLGSIQDDCNIMGCRTDPQRLRALRPHWYPDR